jgi:hypothetical protein
MVLVSMVEVGDLVDLYAAILVIFTRHTCMLLP